MELDGVDGMVTLCQAWALNNLKGLPAQHFRRCFFRRPALMINHQAGSGACIQALRLGPPRESISW